MKWLVTGGCGFIGVSLIRRLVSEGGHSIRVLDNLSVGARQDLAEVCDFTEIDDKSKAKTIPDQPQGAPTVVELIRGDILDEALTLAVASGADVIVHLAANTGVGPSVEDPRQDCRANVMGTFNLLEAARFNKCRRFVFASSGAPIGECAPPIHEELAPHPVSPYGASKLAGEGYCSAYYRTFGVETVALRFGNVYGPGSSHKQSVVAKFIQKALMGEKLEVYGDGGQTRDFIFIEDLVAAIQLAATVEGIGGEVFQIATQTETTVNDLAMLLVNALSAQGIENVHIDHASARVGDVRRNFSDITKARSVLGWNAEVGLADGLKQTVLWFRSRA